MESSGGASPAPSVHSLALNESQSVGAGTRIWPFAHVLSSAVVGEDCNICEGVFIEDGVSIGDRVTIKNGVHLWSGLHVEDDVFIGPHATFCNDPFPRSGERITPVTTILRQGCSVGAGATILPGVNVGAHSMVGAGSVVVDDVPPYAMVVGNPARIAKFIAPAVDTSDRSSSPSTGLALLNRMTLSDRRGRLDVVGFSDDLPFPVRRCFVLSQLRNGLARGVHAHKATSQGLFVLAGEISLLTVDASGPKCMRLTVDSPGVLVPPVTWTTIVPVSEGAILLVASSSAYDAADYIHDYEEFCSLLGA